MATTMALRFRDLVTAPGLTIENHQRVITSNNYVWWGWWNKPNEKIPRATFAEFRQVASQSEMWIFLVDSGREKLYRALVGTITESGTEDVIACPEPTKTPGYYSTASYKAWFQLKTIEESDSPDEIRKWSYDEVEGFLDDPAGDRFQDKRVFNIQEMLNRRHRTIYFLQPYHQGHQDYRLELLPPVSPAHFITTPILSSSNYILQLSDVHFGVGHHGFSLDRDELQRKKLSSMVISDLQRQFKDVPPAAVIMSGDLTWQGQAVEFEYVARFIQELRSVYGLEAHHFVVVPGNHDIQWSAQDADNYEPGKPVTREANESEQNYRDFYKKVFGLAANEYLSLGRRVILSNYVPVDIVGLNSSRLEQKHFAGYGYVSLEQLDDAAERMRWSTSKSKLTRRVLVLHHHLVPVTPKEELEYGRLYSLTLDAGQLTYRAQELGVDLVMHGHMHQPFVSTVSRAARGSGFSSRTMGIHGAGSAGVKRELTGEIGKNSYSVFDFDEDGITLRVRSRSENYEGFDQDWQCYFARTAAGGLEVRSTA